MAVLFNNIPNDLIKFDQWVNWKLENHNGKNSKVPYNAKNGKYAKTNDQTTWSSFELARRNHLNGSHYNGIGFVFSQQDGLFGIDVDHCFSVANSNPAPVPNLIAKEILERFKHTYCEISPSGEGLRIFGYGTPLRCGKGTKEKCVELYNHTSPRYLTVTGNHIKSSSTTLADCQESLNWLHEKFFTPALKTALKRSKIASKQFSQEKDTNLPLTTNDVLEHLKRAKNSSKFETLFSGQGITNDESSDDLALCSMVAFYSQDESVIDAVFRQSKRANLLNGKWDEVHNAEGATYGQMTIRKAIAGLTQTYTPKPALKRSKMPSVESSQERGTDLAPRDTDTTDWVTTVTGDEYKPVATKHPVQLNNVFWYETKAKLPELKIDHVNLYKFIASQGYRQIFISELHKAPAWILVKITNNIVEFATLAQIKDCCYQHVLSQPIEVTENFTRADLESVFLKGVNVFVEQGKLDTTIPPQRIEFASDDKDCLRFFYRNGFIEVTKNDVVLKPYSQLKGYLWSSQILQRDFSIETSQDAIDDECVFNSFTQDICTLDSKNGETFEEQRHYAIKWHLGYMLHRHVCGMNRAVILTEANLNLESAEGRTGKGLLVQAIAQLRNVVTIDGKTIKSFTGDGDRFLWQRVELSTHLVFLDDVRWSFSFESLFSILSEGLTVEKKNQQAFHIPAANTPKFVISTNTAIENETGSAKARKTEMELLCFYSESYTPVQKFGHYFFRDWNQEQWKLFDNFMVQCAQIYLSEQEKCVFSTNPPTYDSDTIELRKLTISTSEVFVEFMNSQLENAFIDSNEFKVIANFFYQNFLEYADFEKKDVSSKKFNKWITIYCNSNGLQFTTVDECNAETGCKKVRFFVIKSI